MAIPVGVNKCQNCNTIFLNNADFWGHECLSKRKEVKMNLQQYNKAIVAGIVGLLGLVAGVYGVQLQPEIVAAVTTLLTVAFVYLIPNKK